MCCGAVEFNTDLEQVRVPNASKQAASLKLAEGSIEKASRKAYKY
jgi:hypothetical protein